MRIVIDLQGAQSESRYRGIGRYSLSLALAVARDNRGHDVHIVLNGAFADTIATIRKAFEGLLAPGNIHVWHVPLPVHGMDRSNVDRIRDAEIIREAAIAALSPDVVHLSSLFEGYGDNSVTSVGVVSDVPTVVTLYDLIPLMNPATYLDPVPPYRMYYEEKLADLRRADALVAISQSAADEARDVLGFDRDKVFNISGACDDVFKPLPKDSITLRRVKEKYGIATDFILYTGGSDNRKNLVRLVQAYAGLEPRQRSMLRLVMAGRMHGPHIEELMALGAASGLRTEELIFTGYVSDRDLVALYNRCRFFVFPSWHEGFGLPVLEAMNCGAAVLASDASSIREIATRKDAMFDPMDVASIRDCMARHLDDEAALVDLREYALTRGAQFSWPLVAAALLDACETVHAGHKAKVVSADRILLDATTALAARADREPSSTLALSDALDRSISPMQRQLLVDVSELAAHDHRTGIQRVTRAVVSEWMANPPAGYRIQLIRIDRASRQYVCANEYMGQLTGQQGQDGPLVCHAGDAFLGLDLVGDTASLIPHWFEYFRATGVSIAFVVYDILPVRHPEWWPLDGGRYHERWLRAVAEYSDRLICISAAVAEDVRSWMDQSLLEHRPELSWFHLGADITGSTPSKGLPADGPSIVQRIKAGTSFLMVGTLEPRKGHAQALAAFERLWSDGEDAMLVIVGKRGWLVDELCDLIARHPERGRRLFWLEAISDEYLEQIYAASSCLLAASQGEGFGLPLIEAAQLGMPVLARDLPVFREVAGDHSSYFSGVGFDALADAVVDWMRAEKAGTLPDIQKLRWLTWKESAKQLEQALLAPLAVKGRGGSRNV
ncbi:MULTISPECIES: glycosyltransferase family 1 protein [unclassified Stenotrophomonas]|jgi:glycosyltransferase involved in cell wall biosynthesis|uniref:glycosyltransferase family 4 protein n=1 Tax=unclassified Stenotrophomonas TaxID=196198 RepID=UPI0024DE3AC0|nr:MULTISPECIES: glycosyltransferase family 1 protein [unclassified Stenotrophomonas]WIA60721.1 glycosyltransferase family 1 protein [Stenotrophomonas sp. BIO128-Bstrain]